MKLITHLDVDVVAVEQEDQVTVMLELAAPGLPAAEPRLPAAVQIVLDRSGSMHGGRLQAAKQALVRLVDRLDPADQFGLVAFADDVQVVVPAQPVTGKDAVRAAIAGLGAGGSTNLSGGLLRGVQEARRVATETGATLLLLSDGKANQGETDPDRLAEVAAAARQHRVTTSTVGIGLGYDEALMAALARGGQGSHVFAEHGDAAAAAVAGEVSGLLATTVQAASLTVRPHGPVDSVRIWNDLPAQGVGAAIVAEIGDLWSDETRRITLTFSVPAMAGLGLAEVAELELRWVALPELVEHTLAMPVNVNVVPGDQAAGRIRDPEVTSELVFLQVQDDKRRAAELLRAGAWDDADRRYAEARARLEGRLREAPSPELESELRIVKELGGRASAGEREWSAKYARMDESRKSRNRGRDDRRV